MNAKRPDHGHRLARSVGQNNFTGSRFIYIEAQLNRNVLRHSKKYRT
jgi:hypothetical protein